MLIGISGSLYSGKDIVVNYLTEKGFKLLSVGGDTEKEAYREQYGESSKHFNDFDSFYNYITENWLANFIIADIADDEELNLLLKRPFFLHISVDSTILFKHRQYMSQRTKGSIEAFIEEIDSISLDSKTSPMKINNQGHFKIFFTSHDKQKIQEKLEESKLWDQTRLRPGWDLYFMRLADLAALRSNCMKRRVGCVIVKENRVVATGYNGTPRHLTNCNEGGCSRCNEGNPQGSSLSTCLCLHGEENALLEAGRDRIGSNSILYCNTCPCLTCSVKIVQTGIKEVVFSQTYSMDDASALVLKEGNVLLRQYKAPIEELFI